MIRFFISHQWKESTRSPYFTKRIVINIFLGLILLQFILSLIVLGFLCDTIIVQIFPGINPVNKVTGILFYYFLADLFIRFYLQELPTLSVTPYLHLPVKKSRIFNYIILKSLLSIYNWAPLLIIIPFSVKVIVPSHTYIYGLTWVLTMLSLIVSNNFISFHLKKYFIVKPIMALLALILVGVLFYLDINNFLIFSLYFEWSILKIASYPFLITIPFFLVWMTYHLAQKLLKRNSYINDIYADSSRYNSVSGNLSFLNKFGITGDLIQLTLRMIWRNKRTRYNILTCLFPLMIAFSYFQRPDSSNYALIFFCVMTTGVFMFQYGMLMFSWESEFFDFMQTKNILKKQYFDSRYRLFFLLNIIGFLLTIPFCLFNYKLVIISFSMLFFNIGINTIIVMFFANYNSERMDLSKGLFFNAEGKNGETFLLLIPFIGIPILIYLPFELLGFPNTGIACIGLIGVLGIVFKNQLIDIIINKFSKRKYSILLGFKK